MIRFTDQVVLITGAGSGIGRAAAVAFAREGAHVVVSDINEFSGQQTVALIIAEGRHASLILCDVADPEQIAQLVHQTLQQHGRLDIAVNNAGIAGNLGKTAEVPA